MNKIVLIALLSITAKLSAQTLSQQQVAIKTPEVAAFNRFIETPVSYYSGVPNISIPLYEIKMNGVTVPISLDYHAGGIRVDQEATVVGLGWSLNYGGTISRKVRGGPDEDNFLFGGSNTSYTSISDFNAMPYATTANVEQRTLKIRPAKDMTGTVYQDFMPDEFYYSALGHSGKFMFSQQQHKFITFPKEDVVIRDYGSNDLLNESYQNGHPFNKWNIQLSDGISVDFGQDAIITQSLGDVSTSRSAKTAWHIKTIRNNFNQTISYSYTGSTSYNNYKFLGEKLTIMDNCGSTSNSHTNYIGNFSYGDATPSSITFPGGSVSFTFSGRDDMPSGTKKLTTITVYNHLGGVVKTILLHYGYFYGNNYDALPLSSYTSSYSSTIPADHQFKRLRLDSLAISGNTSRNITYKFDYYSSSQLPSKYSFAQDHWGFFNGVSNTTLLPPVVSSTYGTTANRAVKPDYSNIFSLKSITYPEGGKREFVYESNMARNNDIPNEMLSIYQDDNLVNKYASISFTGHNNNNFSPSPTSSSGGVYTYTNAFTVGSTVTAYSATGWNCITNYGVYDMGSYLYGTGKVSFILERINPNNSRTTIKAYDALNLGTSANPSTSNDQPLALSPGNYEMTVIAYPYYGYIPPSFDNDHSTSFMITWKEAGTNPVNVGGLRIKEIKYYDNNNALAKQKNYAYRLPVSSTDPTLTTASSGRVVSFPHYVQAIAQKSSCSTMIPNGIAIYGNSVVPLESTSGSYSGYTYVSETETDGTTTLRSDYEFSFAEPYVTPYYDNYTHSLAEGREWERGKLLMKKQFNGTQVAQSEEYSYYSWSPHLSDAVDEEYIEEIKTDLISSQSMNAIGGGPPIGSADFYDRPNLVQDIAAGNIIDYSFSAPTHYDQVSVPYFKRSTAFDKLKTKTITTYDTNGNGVVETEQYFYERTPDHYQLSKMHKSTGNGDLIKTAYKYAPDYANITASDAVSQGIKNLGTSYVTSIPIETSVSRSEINGSNTRVISSSFTSFKPATPLPDVTYMVESATPLTNFVPSSVQSGAVTMDSRYKPSASYSHFDSQGNILQMQKVNGPANSYIWGYNSLYPIAEARNASLAEIYHQNFEDGSDLDGNTSRDNTRAHTGLYSGKIVNTGSGEVVSHSGTWLSIPFGEEGVSRRYLYSVWVYSTGPSADIFLFMKRPNETGYYSYVSAASTVQTGNWTLVQGIADVPYDVNQLNLRLDNNSNGTVWYDDLRLHPAEALMSTHTYKPLVGIGSTIDTKNETTYYEYDAFSRLKAIRDQYGNVVKSFTYNYKQ